jgi:hypothetical protein
MRHNIKNLSQNDIDLIVSMLALIQESKFRNVVLFLLSMIAFSYYEFNGVRNDKIANYNQLKTEAKKLVKEKC